MFVELNSLLGQKLFCSVMLFREVPSSESMFWVQAVFFCYMFTKRSFYIIYFYYFQKSLQTPHNKQVHKLNNTNSNIKTNKNSNKNTQPKQETNKQTNKHKKNKNKTKQQRQTLPRHLQNCVNMFRNGAPDTVSLHGWCNSTRIAAKHF